MNITIVKKIYKKFHGLELLDDIGKIKLIEYKWIKQIFNLLASKISYWSRKRKIKRGKDLKVGNNFMSNDIKQWIIEHTFYEYYLMNDTFGKIYIYNLSELDEKLINKIIRITELIYNLSTNKNKVHIIIILTPFKKSLNITDKCIGCNNVNSGMSDGTKVIVWRHEEMDKVLIHELIHHHQLDFGDTYITQSKKEANETLLIENNFLKNIKLNNKKRLILNEAYTETLATIINCAIYSFDNKQDFDRLIVFELWHSLIQVVKLLTHFGFKTMNEFLGLDDGQNIMCEETNVFAYYILKSYLLFSIPYVFNFIYCKKNIKNYRIFIKEIIIDDKHWVHIINWIIDNYSESNNNLRMTLFGELSS
jgi:hypothetical protein